MQRGPTSTARPLGSYGPTGLPSSSSGAGGSPLLLRNLASNNSNNPRTNNNNNHHHHHQKSNGTTERKNSYDRSKYSWWQGYEAAAPPTGMLTPDGGDSTSPLPPSLTASAPPGFPSWASPSANSTPTSSQPTSHLLHSPTEGLLPREEEDYLEDLQNLHRQHQNYQHLVGAAEAVETEEEEETDLIVSMAEGNRKPHSIGRRASLGGPWTDVIASSPRRNAMISSPGGRPHHHAKAASTSDVSFWSSFSVVESLFSDESSLDGGLASLRLDDHTTAVKPQRGGLAKSATASSKTNAPTDNFATSNGATTSAHSRGGHNLYAPPTATLASSTAGYNKYYSSRNAASGGGGGGGGGTPHSQSTSTRPMMQSNRERRERTYSSPALLRGQNGLAAPSFGDHHHHQHHNSHHPQLQFNGHHSNGFYASHVEDTPVTGSSYQQSFHFLPASQQQQLHGGSSSPLLTMQSNTYNTSSSTPTAITVTTSAGSNSPSSGRSRGGHHHHQRYGSVGSSGLASSNGSGGVIGSQRGGLSLNLSAINGAPTAGESYDLSYSVFGSGQRYGASSGTTSPTFSPRYHQHQHQSGSNSPRGSLQSSPSSSYGGGWDTPLFGSMGEDLLFYAGASSLGLGFSTNHSSSLLLQLPSHILLKILGYLGAKELAHVECVCKGRLQALASDNSLWKALYLSKWKLFELTAEEVAASRSQQSSSPSSRSPRARENGAVGKTMSYAAKVAAASNSNVQSAAEEKELVADASAAASSDEDDEKRDTRQEEWAWIHSFLQQNEKWKEIYRTRYQANKWRIGTLKMFNGCWGFISQQWDNSSPSNGQNLDIFFHRKDIDPEGDWFEDWWLKDTPGVSRSQKCGYWDTFLCGRMVRYKQRAAFAQGRRPQACNITFLTEGKDLPSRAALIASVTAAAAASAAADGTKDHKQSQQQPSAWPMKLTN
ncbi:F-box only protein 11 [Balamuthia mandrillaris]